MSHISMMYYLAEPRIRSVFYVTRLIDIPMTDSFQAIASIKGVPLRGAAQGCGMSSKSSAQNKSFF